MSRPLSLAKRLFGLLVCLAIWIHVTNWAAADLITRPDGAGSFYYLAFVTSATHTAESDDIGTYNTWVTQQANAVPELNSLGVDWYVIGSTDAVDARDNIAQTVGTVPVGVSAPVYDLQGHRIADDLDDLWSGSIQHNIDQTELGGTYTGNVFTGSYANGTEYVWYGFGGTQGTLYGNSGFSNDDWMNISYVPKHLLGTTPGHFYAISGVMPEPGSLSLGVSMALLVAGGAWYRRRRRRRNNA